MTPCKAAPGADDNASGVAGLLELSRAFASAPTRTHGPVRRPSPTRSRPFASPSTWAARSMPRRHGPRRADHAYGPLEMLGYYDDRPGSQRYPPLFRRFYPDRGNFLGFVGDLRSRGVLRQAAAAFRATSKLPDRELRYFPLDFRLARATMRHSGARAIGPSWSPILLFTAMLHYHSADDVPRENALLRAVRRSHQLPRRPPSLMLRPWQGDGLG